MASYHYIIPTNTSISILDLIILLNHNSDNTLLMGNGNPYPISFNQPSGINNQTNLGTINVPDFTPITLRNNIGGVSTGLTDQISFGDFRTNKLACIATRQSGP